MSDHNPPYDLTRPYDARSNPNRGVRVHPMPKMTHRRFKRFLRELDALCQSHEATWRLAMREQADPDTVRVNLLYWKAARRFLNTVEYLGTANDPATRRQPPTGKPHGDPGVIGPGQRPPGEPGGGDRPSRGD